MRVYGTALIMDNQLVFGSFNGKIYFVDPETGLVKDTFQTAESKNTYSALFDNQDKFRNDVYDKDYLAAEKQILALGAILSSPVSEQNTLYFGDSNGYFYAVKNNIK
ncbi:hypothetical protein TH53_07320 [Pedobacter lusitanus]|uniref:Contig29, whole genome shotgun sequence n=1 Tax=Pedobacter lusitanus TaxID=1503925 RepID=A0A0D0GKI3_9SPHI|nr:hypothetical protein TH53_07320 [Pedobacter lusitanus]